MKIVLNRCFGGFGLSVKAELEIYRKQGIRVYPYIVRLWDLGESNILKRYTGQKINQLTDSIWYLSKDPFMVEFEMSFDDLDEKYGFAEEIDYSEAENRNNHNLVEVVEKLGKESWGAFSKLEVIEIPDGYDFYISDYDGAERCYFGLNMGEV